MTASGEDPGLARSTVLVAAVGIFFVALMAFSLLKWTDAKSTTDELRGRIAELEPVEEELARELAGLRTQLDRLRSQTDVFARGEFRACNFSDEPITISKLAATYLNEEGEFETFNSERHRGVRWSLQPGETRALSHADSGWGGAVTYYALWIEQGGNEYPFAGTWPLEEEYCLRFAL